MGISSDSFGGRLDRTTKVTIECGHQFTAVIHLEYEQIALRELGLAYPTQDQRPTKSPDYRICTLAGETVPGFPFGALEIRGCCNHHAKNRQAMTRWGYHKAYLKASLQTIDSLIH